jgi:hypothetical protein
MVWGRLTPVNPKGTEMQIFTVIPTAASKTLNMIEVFPVCGKLAGYTFHVHAHYTLLTCICELTGRDYCRI